MLGLVVGAQLNGLPDMTPLDFSVWGISRDLVYLDGPKSDIQTLKEYVKEVFRTIFTPDLCTKICGAVARRVQLCMLSIMVVNLNIFNKI
jgi:hypothetical protein